MSLKTESQKLLPIGIHTFKDIRSRNFVYVDKTKMIHSLWENGAVYFLSRPRRFGKSLLIDTMEQLVRSKKDLFKGLWIEDKWDWNTNYPVVRFDFGAGTSKTIDDLHQKIHFYLKQAADEYGLEIEDNTISNQFQQLLIDLNRKCQRKVVVLVDEYDKPILDNINNPEVSEVMRDGLKNLYSVLKAQQASLRFVFLTGVSKFAKVSIFSGLNHPEDISLSPHYATICGYTQTDLEQSFADWLSEDVDLALVKQWYNGYNFLGEKVYNPYDVLLYLKNRIFEEYWFRTGTPDSLMSLVKKRGISLIDLKKLYSSSDLLNKFDVSNLTLEGYLFQTGYLTIKEIKPLPRGGQRYILGFPNLEVERAISSLFLETQTPSSINAKQENGLIQGVLEGKPELFEEPIRTFMASIPFDWYKFSKMDLYEGYYSSIVYALFANIGFNIILEDTTNHGRMDMVISEGNHLFIIEFKIKGRGSDPIKQIKESKYPEKYQNQNKDIWLVGIIFDREDRNIFSFQWEKFEG